MNYKSENALHIRILIVVGGCGCLLVLLWGFK